MRTTIRFLRPLSVVSVAATGAYEQTIPEAWDFLRGLLTRHGAREACKPVLALLHDLPQSVRAQDRRLELCAAVHNEQRFIMRQDATLQTFSGGAHLIQTHRGPHAALIGLFSSLYASCSLDMNVGLDPTRPRVLIFIGDPLDVPPDELVTDLCMPIVNRAPDRPRRPM